MQHRSHRLLVVLSLVTAACGGSSADRAPTAAPPVPAAAAPAPAPARADRFDELVRDDFFAGLLHGDTAALDRAMKLCEDALAKNPEHGEALAWHGAGLVARSGTAFQAGDQAGGMALWNRGLAEMDRAVELEPDEIGTIVPRGSVLFATAPFVSEPRRSALLDKALGDYQHALELQEPNFGKLTSHARSQLLYGLADGWHRRGDDTRARGFYQRLSREAAGTRYGERADAYLAGKAEESPMACGGCHAR